MLEVEMLPGAGQSHWKRCQDFLTNFYFKFFIENVFYLMNVVLFLGELLFLAH